MVEKQLIGIDFGTTNSLISVVTRKNIVKSFSDSNKPHPSVITYEGEKIISGRRAREKLDVVTVGVIGNTVRGPKKFISSDTINIEGRLMSPESVIGDYMRYLINHALEEDIDNVADLTNAVVTIPVAMDGRGRKVLRQALLNAGVRIELFVHEPLAALYCYLREQENFQSALAKYDGKLILVFDWGGGTLDLTLCKITNGDIVQILNRGNNLVGGDYLDDAIFNHVIDQHAQKYGWTRESALPENPGMRAKLLYRCEQAKIELSTREKTNIFVPGYFSARGDAAEIDIWLTRDELNTICSNIIRIGINEIHSLLSIDHADIDIQTIALCLATGGMVRMKLIQERLLDVFGFSNLHLADEGDFIISKGAAWLAHDRVNITLAKPFELAEARNSLIPIMAEGTELPKRGHSIQRKQSTYCCDPRDGKAVFTFKRPQMVYKSGAADPRVNYGNLVVEVNQDFEPLGERIQLTTTIDENLILKVEGVAEDQQISNSVDFYDLEFAVSIGDISRKYEKEESSNKKVRYAIKHSRSENIVVKSNISIYKTSWSLVPGELLYEYNQRHNLNKKELTEIQRLEHVRYQPCICGARWTKGCCDENSYK